MTAPLPESLSTQETFDRIHDGAQVIDPEKCALALFVTNTGQVRIRSPFSTAQVAGMLRELAGNLDKRAGQ